MDRKRILQGVWLIALYFFLTYIGTTSLSTLSLDYQIATVSAADDPGKIIRLSNYQSLKNQKHVYKQALAEIAYKLALYTLLDETMNRVSNGSEGDKSPVKWPCKNSGDDIDSLKSCLAAGLRSYIRDPGSVKFPMILEKVNNILKQQKTDMGLIADLEIARKNAVEQDSLANRDISY